jgi:hypothetical protein
MVPEPNVSCSKETSKRKDIKKPTAAAACVNKIIVGFLGCSGRITDAILRAFFFKRRAVGNIAKLPLFF